jgi:hypothetical protein
MFLCESLILGIRSNVFCYQSIEENQPLVANPISAWDKLPISVVQEIRDIS